MAEKKLKSFAYENVRLKPGHWEEQRRELTETYLGIDNDDLLHYFRKLAGISDKGTGLVGWYGGNASTFGQMLGAMAHLWQETGDERLKKKVLFLAEEWEKCGEVSERIYDVNDTYVYDKLMGGLLDVYEVFHLESIPGFLRKLTQSAVRRFPREIKRDGLQDRELSEARMIEWYTLPEQLYRAWELTGEEIYRDFAQQWDYPYFFDKLSSKDFRIGPRHAYSHVNSLSSAARAFENTGKETYLQAIQNGYEEILSHHTFATGGYGPAECLFPEEEGYLGDSLKDNWDQKRTHKEYRNFGDTVVTRDDAWGSCEVSCCSWAVFKLTRYLMELTGEARYGVWAERMLYNCCGGQPPITPEGKVMYYADYFLNGGLKTVEDRRLQENGASFEWQCCTGTFPEDVAEYANLLYYKGENGLYVAQYLPSEVDISMQGENVTLENCSMFPKDQRIRFVLHTGRKVHGSIHFRVPDWAEGKNRIFINGEVWSSDVRPDTWAVLTRSWEDGDEVILEFPFGLKLKPVDERNPDIAALIYGPLVLVCDKMAVFQGDVEHPEEWIVPSWREGYSFTFETKPGHVKGFPWLTRRFYPYYEVPQMEWYYMYQRYEDRSGNTQTGSKE